MKKQLIYLTALASLAGAARPANAQEIFPIGPQIQKGDYKVQEVYVPRITITRVPVNNHNPIWEQTPTGFVFRGYNDSITYREQKEVKWSRETLSSYSPQGQIDSNENRQLKNILPPSIPISPPQAPQQYIQGQFIPPRPNCSARNLLEAIVTFPFEVTGQTSRFLLNPSRLVQTENEYWNQRNQEVEFRRQQMQLQQQFQQPQPYLRRY